MQNNRGMAMAKIGIIGGGSWGKALASIVRRNGNEVILYDSRRGFVYGLDKSGNLSGVGVVSDLDALSSSDMFVVAVPAQCVRKVVKEFCDALTKYHEFEKKNASFVVGSKGIENESLLLMSQVLQGILSNRRKVAIISGPNFASEILDGKLAIANLACEDEVLGKYIAGHFNTDFFRVDCIDDVIGVQVWGALKNVYAIVSGLVMGFCLGANAQAAFFTTAVREAMLVVEALGGKRESAVSASGIGDMLLTCTNATSRNMRFGLELARGEDPVRLVSTYTVEGYYTIAAAYKICAKFGLDAKIVNFLHKVLYEDKRYTIDEIKMGLYAII